MNQAAGELQRQAIMALQQGRIEDGIAAYSALLEKEPGRPDDWYNLAYLYRCNRDFEEALDAYGKALFHAVGRPEEVHLNRAVILADHLDRASDALEELDKATVLNPGFVPAWLNLGTLNEDLGNREKARSAYQAALRVDPGNGRAQARLAAIEIFEGKGEDAIRRLTPLVEVSANRPEDQVEMLFALGNALDANGHHAEAFRVIDVANREARALMPAEFRYDRAAMEALVDGVIRAFPSAAIRSDAPGSSRPPIFLCGMFRSGSTLAEQILGRHRDVTTGGELEFLPAIVQSRLQPFPDSLLSLDGAKVDAMRDAYMAELAARFPAALRVTDKRPDNFLHIGLIKSMFPDAKIVHTLRNPVDNALSIYFLHFEYAVNYGFSLDDIAHWFGLYRRIMAHWKSLYPDDILDLDYDRLVADPEPVVSGLLSFCGLSDDPACRAQEPSNAVVRTASVWQVRQPLHARSSGRWLRYREQLQPVAAALGVTAG
jgi:cytochrome c-type biogenesis protein CcmH/NrfG